MFNLLSPGKTLPFTFFIFYPPLKQKPLQKRDNKNIFKIQSIRKKRYY
jgi:hypothetical protein